MTDDVVEIFKAIELYLPNLTRLRCWSYHTISAAKVWLQKHRVSASEIPVYVSHLHGLFHQPCEEAYVQVLQSNWSRPFAEYFIGSS